MGLNSFIEENMLEVASSISNGLFIYDKVSCLRFPLCQSGQGLTCSLSLFLGGGILRRGCRNLHRGVCSEHICIWGVCFWAICTFSQKAEKKQNMIFCIMPQCWPSVIWIDFLFLQCHLPASIVTARELLGHLYLFELAWYSSVLPCRFRGMRWKVEWSSASRAYILTFPGNFILSISHLMLV